MAKYTEVFELYLPENRDPSQIHEFNMQENFIKLEELILGKSSAGQDFAMWQPDTGDSTTRKTISDVDGTNWQKHVDSSGNTHNLQFAAIHKDDDSADLGESIIRRINEGSNPSTKIDGSFLNVQIDSLEGVQLSSLLVQAPDDDSINTAKSELQGHTMLVPNDYGFDPINKFEVQVESTFSEVVYMSNDFFVSTQPDANIWKGTAEELNRYLTKGEIIQVIKDTVREYAGSGNIPKLVISGPDASITVTSTDGTHQAFIAVEAVRTDFLKSDGSTITVDVALSVPTLAVSSTSTLAGVTATTLDVTGDVTTGILSASSLTSASTITAGGDISTDNDIVAAGMVVATGEIRGYSDVIGYYGG
jgi:hypothetical protein